ncbi:MAG: hypothetical protein K2J71_03655 [Oscillospiraceae bacterium]|nr:hypothetical protein [Oscillospiraceae bacterium]
MALFGNSRKHQAGIAKDAPEKKPFFRYWEIVFRKFWKIIDVNMLLAVGCLPLILAFVVMYYFSENYAGTAFAIAAVLILVFAVCFGSLIAACTQILRNFAREKPMFLMNTFWNTFRSSFKQACPVGIIDLVMMVSVASSLYVYPKLIQANGSTIYYILFVATLSIALAVTMMSFYAYLMIVSTDLKFGDMLKNSLALSFIALKKNFLTLLLAILIMGSCALVTYLFPYIFVLWFFIPTGFVAFMIVFNCYPVIQKFVINPYYAQKGEVNPEILRMQSNGENLFEDRGGSELPPEETSADQNPKQSKNSGSQKKQSGNHGNHRKKGKVIS